MAAFLTQATYAAVIGEIVNDERTCEDCGYAVTVSVSAVAANVFSCAHTVESISATLDASEITYAIKTLASGRLIVKLNRWANRSALEVR
jgi:hypothetical protein